MDHQHANKQRFDAVANDWDQDPQRVYTGQKIGRAMRNALSPEGGETALELGAGTGLATLLIAPVVKRLTAIDSSEGMLEVLKNKLARKGLDNVKTVIGVVPNDLPREKFNLIYSALTLHHVENPKALIKTLAGRLKPGGRIALADLDAEDGSFHGGDSHGVAHHGFKRDTIKAWLTEAGFEGIEITTVHTIQKQDEDGNAREFPVFLASATLATSS